MISERPSVLEPLPLAEGRAPERADAARNRTKILAAAADVLAERGAAALSVDEVAGRAGVGVGTIYRRFGDRSGLLWALLDDRERAFQESVLSGHPPLGPGAPAGERLRAFLHALLDHVDEHREQIISAEAQAPGQHGGPYELYRSHVVMLLGRLVPGDDTEVLADALLAPLSATHIDRQRRHHGYDLGRMKRGIDRLLTVVES